MTLAPPDMSATLMTIVIFIAFDSSRVDSTALRDEPEVGFVGRLASVVGEVGIGGAGLEHHPPECDRRWQPEREPEQSAAHSLHFWRGVQPDITKDP